MNFVYLSPHFPPNFYNFCVHLNRLGANVFGIADAEYSDLRPELKDAFAEYYKVNDMHNYDELVRAMGFLTFKYGKIDRIDSHNEYWLETEAQLRTDFNITGTDNDDIENIKYKSKMKEVFVKNGIPAARGRVVHNENEAKELIAQTGYPVIAKPDKGVGAADTYKIKNENELKLFFEVKPSIDYIMEEFIAGEMCTFDGLTDKDGNLVFFTGHQYDKGIMEAVNDNDHVFYYSFREIPKDLEEIGRKMLKAFNVREKFFHFEFFRLLKDKKLVVCEVNMRPPGGMTVDMFNFANDIDIYREWANIIVNNRFEAQYSRPYHCCYIGRKAHKNYCHTNDEIIQKFGEKIVHHEPINSIFSNALGNYGYLVRSPKLEDIFEMAKFIHETH